VLIAFQAGSSELPASALASLKVLSQQRGGNPIAVTGYGDLTGTEASAQAKAAPLALERARVVAARLLALGVPANAVRINAEAQGRGAAARIVR
jgi:outer membrane protein OmpA-like peptidoglycan-associated protein